MFSKYIDDIRAAGRRHFTFQEIMNELNISNDSVKSGVYRLKKSEKIISPLKGLYVIVPPEHRPVGSIPAEELVPIIMRHIEADYYVALLSAAVFHGASHQRVFKFQIITDKRIEHPLHFGEVEIDVIYKKSLKNLPTKDIVVSTGYLKVATPELTAIDLFKFPIRSGGISHIATVLYELIENIDECKLITLAENINEICQLQRIGYVVERLDTMDEEKKLKLVSKLEEYLKNIKRPYISLVSNMPRVGFARCKKWRVIENSDFESDL